MKTEMKLRLPAFVGFAVAVALMVFGGTANAQNHFWVGGGPDNEFSTAANWDTNTVPTDATDPVTGVLLDNFRDVRGVFTVERSIDSNTTRVAYAEGAVINIPSGSHSDVRPGASIYTLVGNDGPGTVNQSGGTYNVGHGLRVGTTNVPDSEGTYNLTGGDLIVSRGSNSSLAIAPEGGRPSLEVGSDPSIEGTTGSFTISGTSSLATRAPAHLLGTGTFVVSGSSVASIGIGSSGTGDGAWFQQSGGILSPGLDGGGVTVILIDEVDGDGVGGDVTFEPGSILDPFDAGGANNAWTAVMTWEGTLVNNGLDLSSAAVSAGWEMRVMGNSLEVRNPNFPEPMMGLVGDFNGDFVVDCADLDGYVGNIGAAAEGALEALDIDGDGFLSLTDADTHIRTLVVTSNGVTGTFLGDVNCDGSVTVLGDAFALVANLNNAVTTYAQGDLNFDGQVTVLGDAFTLVANLNMSNQ